MGAAESPSTAQTPCLGVPRGDGRLSGLGLVRQRDRVQGRRLGQEHAAQENGLEKNNKGRATRRRCEQEVFLLKHDNDGIDRELFEKQRPFVMGVPETCCLVPTDCPRLASSM